MGEERNPQTGRNPYLYTGKEQDIMTGLYYYEQRYYDPNKSTFLGVDPLAEKYAGISGYAYVANNPIVLVDPDGQEPDDPLEGFISAVKNYACQKIYDFVTGMATAVIQSAKEEAVDVVNNTKGSIYINADVAISAGANKSIKLHGFWGDATLANMEIASAEFEYDQTAGLTGDANVVGKNGEVTIGHAASAGYYGLDVGASHSNTIKAQEGVQKSETKITSTYGIPLIIGAGAQYQKKSSVNENSSHTLRTGIFSNGSFGLGWRASYNISVGYKLTYQKKDHE